jgi:Flp pilus assembly protein TadG
MSRLLTKLRGGMDNRGAAAVEFAIVFGLFLLPLFIGMIEITTLLRAQAKLNAFANDVALMISIESSSAVTNGVYNIPVTSTAATSLTDICNGAVAGFAPYPTGTMTLQIASVTEEAGSNGTPSTNTSTSFVHNGTSLYDQWEQDFTVSGGSCVAAATTGIGATNAVNLVTSNPPSTTGGGTGGLVQYPCDNGVVVTASVQYPGLLGLLINGRTTLKQSAYQRWRYTSPQSEMQCPNCTLASNNAIKTFGTVVQTCNTADTSAQN